MGSEQKDTSAAVGGHMIRIRLDNEIYTVKKVESYRYSRHIVFCDKDDRYTVTVESNAKLEELMDQALKCGYIDFSKEKVTYKYE
jgi:hypothetical protein